MKPSTPTPKESMFSGTGPQLLAVLSGTISAVSDGMWYGWSAPLIPVLKGPNTPVKITHDDEMWIENIYLTGGLVGVPLTILLVDRIGRKNSVLAAAVINFIGWMLVATASHRYSLFVARFMAGMAGDVAFVAAPMYIAEIADQKIRGFLATLIYLMMLVGILLIYVIGPYVPVYISSLVGAVFVSIQLLTFPFMPASPYYLLSKNKYTQAKKALSRLRTVENIDKELSEIKEAVERQKTERGRPQDLIMEKSNRKASIILVVLNGAQHLSCMSVMFMNMHLILEAAGSIYLESNYAAILYAALMIVAAGSAGFVIDRFGRKILLIISSILTGLTLLTLAVYFHLKQLGYNVDTISWIPIFCVMFYALALKIGLGLIPIVLTAELFPAKVKAVGMALADGAYLFWALVSVFIYQYTSNNLGMCVPFYIFAVSALGTALFCYLGVPETKGKTLEEIQMILKGMPLNSVNRSQHKDDYKVNSEDRKSVV